MLLKTLEELNRDFMTDSQASKKKIGLKPIKPLVNILFFLAIIMILVISLVPGSDNGAPKMIFDYSYFTVLTPSMQDEIPQDSFILVKKVNPWELKTGDNITYMIDRSISVTHKIIDIYENYDNSGARGFQTQGVNNINPDQNIVYEANVVGKVVLVLPGAGAVLSKLSENIFIIIVLLSICLLLSFFFRGVFTKSTKQVLPKAS